MKLLRIFLILSAYLSTLGLNYLSAQELNYPDNIIGESDCVVPFEEIEFDVKHKWASPNGTGHNMTGALVGDLDGDGIPEIITYGSDLKTLYVLNGSDGTVKFSMPINAIAGSGGWHPVMTAVLVDADRNKMGEIILATTDNKLTSYEATITNNVFGLNKKWETTFVNPTSADVTPQPIVTDFNGDGIPEILVYNQIYNAKTGEKLGETESIDKAYVGRIANRASNQATNFIAVGDFDGDGYPEVAAGGKIYRINISADGKSATSTIIYEIPKNNNGDPYVQDGYTAVADLDLDGELDVVVVDYASNVGRVTIWSPKKGIVIDQFDVPNSNAWQGYPFIGDIDGFVDVDGKRYPEICLVTGRSNGGTVHAFKYNSGTKTYSQKWGFNNSDKSGGTGITLFDFNNDGINELVYRDETHIYILNGINDGDDPKTLDSFTCTSSTAFEYPVIADIDGSGSAKICVTCNSNGISGNSNTLNAYESGNSPWAPTRKVWNQVNYDPVLINEDLTVPLRIFPKQTAFTVGGQQYNPYNGALIQVPIMDMELNPVVQAADAYVSKIQATLVDENTVKLSVVVGNQGILNASSSLPVSLYENNLTDCIGTKTLGVTLAPGEFVTLDFVEIGIENLASSYIARVQDNQGTYPAQGYLDCNSFNDALTSGNIFANDDRFVAFMNKSNNLNVLANDVIPTDLLSLKVEIKNGPTHGTAILGSGNQIEYTPNPEYFGEDVIEYELSSDENVLKSTAFVYIQIIPQPDNISDADCYVNPESTDFTIKELGSYGNNGTEDRVHSMSTPLVADLEGDGPKIIVPRYDTNYAVNQWGRSNGLVIVDVNKNTSREIETVNFGTHGQSIAIADVDGNGECSIFIQSADDSKIYCYDPKGNLKTGYPTIVTNEHYIIQLADLNNDGKVELIAGPYIFDAKSGNLLLQMTFDLTKGTAYGNPHNRAKDSHGLTYGGYYFMPAIGDVDGDGYLEIVAGGVVYKPAPDFSGWEKIEVNPNGLSSDFNGWLDGPTLLVDFDKDGLPDVCVIGHQNTATSTQSYFQFYVWNPRTKEVIAYAPQSTIATSVTIPYVGDLDGNGYPDVAFATSRIIGMMSYQYDKSKPGNISAGPTMSAFAETAGFCLFDFNQDGKADIVYRGVRSFYIVNVNENGTGYDELTPWTTVYSGTVAEYPIVADVDGDGQAEIILTRSDINWTDLNDLRGVVSVYKSADPENPWAPARSVWNQWAFNGTLINDDMTVPQYPINPATKFPGKDGQLGTEDDVQPYNGFLMQQTILSRDGVPLFLTPNAVIPDNGKDIKFDYNTLTDVLTIKDLKISNVGDAVLQRPIKISVYKETVPSNTKFIYSWDEDVSAGETKTVPDFEIPNFSNYLPSTSVLIRINDNGTGFNYQPVCDDCCVSNESDVFVDLPLDALGWADSYRKCIGESVTFTGSTEIAGNDAVFSWYDAKNSIVQIGNPVTKPTLALPDSGQYILKVDNYGVKKNLSLTVKLPFLSVAPEILRWKPKTTNSNWNDLNNWNDNNGNSYKAIPAGCTTVHLPAVAEHYPSFDKNNTDRSIYGDPMAGTIIYHYGAQTPYPHLLTYDKAKVQYNFGYYNVLISGNQPDNNKEGAAAQNIKRDTWYPLAAPLKKIASGDFSFGGYPITWQALSDLISGDENFYTMNFDKSNGANDVDLSETHNSIVVKMPSYESGSGNIGLNNHKHLQSLQGVLEIPYFENAAENTYHPSHNYDKYTGKSTFYYFNNETLQQIHNPFGQMKRGEEAYRFVFEEEDKTIPVVNVKGERVACYTMTISSKNKTKQALIGNPFMATINMKNFYEVNADVLENTGYYIYDNSNVPGSWKTYSYDINNGVNPLQAFVVVFKESAAGKKLLFPLEGDYALTGTSTGVIPMRAELPGTLSVRVSNDKGMGGDYAELNPMDTRNDLSTDGNVRKLISENNTVPEVFFVNNNGTTYNLIQLYNQEVDEISLGIRYSDTGTRLTLTFDQIDEFSNISGKTPILVDKLLNVKQDLSQNSTYSFIHTATDPSSSSDVARFAIRLGDESEMMKDDQVNIYYKGGQLTIETSAGIKSVNVYSLSGQLIYTNGLSGKQNSFSQNLGLQTDTYIVKVETADNNSVTRKIVITN